MVKQMARVRAPEQTRKNIINSAFDEIRTYGYQGCSLDRILKNAKVTKGALYHHFENKAALGIAVLDEVIETFLYKQWGPSLENQDDPIQCMIDRINEMVEKRFAEDLPVLGLPLGNFVQEMAPLDKTFLLRVRKLFKLWQELIAVALQQGQAAGTVRKDINIEQSALFLVTAYEGVTSIVRASQTREMLQDTASALIAYLETLKA
ncbi:MAG: TetR/AcrR family transcriptional regulator [Gammaproteobacteria bacterium]|nr:MAG: TetR/AcrR family transcriptional regulator [Gammaproteobacteria bacterium]